MRENKNGGRAGDYISPFISYYAYKCVRVSFCPIYNCIEPFLIIRLQPFPQIRRHPIKFGALKMMKMHDFRNTE